MTLEAIKAETQKLIRENFSLSVRLAAAEDAVDTYCIPELKEKIASNRDRLARLHYERLVRFPLSEG